MPAHKASPVQLSAEHERELNDLVRAHWWRDMPKRAGYLPAAVPQPGNHRAYHHALLKSPSDSSVA